MVISRLAAKIGGISLNWKSSPTVKGSKSCCSSDRKQVSEVVPLAHVLVLTVLVDHGKSPSGALGKFVEILVRTGFHERDAVDLHSL